MRKDLTKVLVESTVERAIREMKESPERSARNLIDLGLHFSTGRFQTNFLNYAQKMLHDEQSAYYTFIKDTISHVDSETLATFGVNLGYNGCTKGAKTIRTIESEKQFNIPWILSFAIDREKDDSCPSFYSSLVKQGMALGIHAYLIYGLDNPDRAIPLINNCKDCAFVLFLKNDQVTDKLIMKLKAVKNVMVSVHADGNMERTCGKLRKAHLLYSVYHGYTPQEENQILSGKWLNSVLSVHPTFAFLFAETSCNPKVQQEVYEYTLTVREGQQHPIFLMDIKQDLLMIDKIISTGQCLAGFDYNGNLFTDQGIIKDKVYNIYEHPLESVLQALSA